MERNLRLIGLGVRAALRNGGLRLLALAGALAAGVFAWNQGNTPGPTALVLSLWLGRIYGIAACLWLAYAALRDLDERAGAVFRSKPVDGARWVLVTWLTGLCVWLALLGAAFLGAALGQLPRAGLLSLASHGWGFARAALVLAAMGSLSFALSRMMRSPLGGVLTTFAWFCAIAGLTHIPQYLQPELSQNLSLFLGASLLLLCLAALLVERFRRGELRRPLAPVAIVLAAAALTAAGAARAYRQAARMGTDDYTVPNQIALQYLQPGERVPGFWLPDGRGGTVRTADHEGKVLLVYLFAADDLDAARTLASLSAIAREFRGRGVQPLGVCLSVDQGDGRALARAGGYGFPIGADTTTVRTTAPPESPVAVAYDVRQLPLLVVTDRRRRVREVSSDPTHDVETLRRLVEQRLSEEPE